MKLPKTPFNTAMAFQAGLRRTHLARLVSAGVVRRPFRGVYCPAQLPDTLAVRAECAALVLPPQVVVADRSAAWLHGVDCLRHAETRIVPRLEVVSAEGNPTRAIGMYGGKRQLLSDEVMIVHGVPVTTPVRTAIDLACLRGGAQGLATVESFMRECGLTTLDLTRQLARHKGRRGVIQARSLAAMASPESESAGESRTKWYILDAGLPAPEQQLVVDLDGWGEVRLDFAYAELKIAIEYDGAEFHGRKQTARDQARRKALRDAGWKVIVVRSEDLSPEAREVWLGEIRAAISKRLPTHRRTHPPKQRSH